MNQIKHRVLEITTHGGLAQILQILTDYRKLPELILL